MSKYFDWRIDSDKKVNNLLWLREYDDGKIKVVREYDGIWKLSQEEWHALDHRDPNVIANATEFKEELQRRGYMYKKSYRVGAKVVRAWVGIKLKTSTTEPQIPDDEVL